MEERLGPMQHGLRKGDGITDMVSARNNWVGIQSAPFHSFSGCSKAFNRVP